MNMKHMLRNTTTISILASDLLPNFKLLPHHVLIKTPTMTKFPMPIPIIILVTEVEVLRIIITTSTVF